MENLSLQKELSPRPNNIKTVQNIDEPINCYNQLSIQTQALFKNLQQTKPLHVITKHSEELLSYSLCPKTISKTQQKLPLSALMDSSNDDAFIAQFAALSSEEGNQTRIQLDQTAIDTRDWNLTAMVRVVTDKGVLDSFFAKTMRKAWQIQCEIIPLSNSVFLVQFSTNADMQRVM